MEKKKSMKQIKVSFDFIIIKRVNVVRELWQPHATTDGKVLLSGDC